MDPQFLQRDGTSQAQRQQAALSPDYVAVDERSIKDLLAFARQFATELRYYDLGENRALGDWSAFFGPDLDLDAAVAFLRDPASVPESKSRPFKQPHVVLFFTFLELLRIAQQQMNTLTQRHLDFFYRQVLRMSKRPAFPDKVHVLAELAPGADQALVRAGTRLQAGKDSLGQAVFYQTDRDLIANRAQVERVSSLYVERRVTGIREARELYTGPKNEGFVRMMEIALGEPKPGDPLPHYDGQTVDYPFLLSRMRLLNVSRLSLFLEFFDFRDLMRRKRQRDQADAEWKEINRLLEKAGRTRTKNRGFRLNPATPRDFDGNTVAAFGGAPNFAGLTEVDSLTDLYEQRIRQDVQEFIRERLFFEDVDDFVRMMQIKVRVDNEWREINRLLEKAGRKKRSDDTYTLPVSASPDFNVNLPAALGTPDFKALAGVDGIDQYHDAFLRVEKFFFMSAEDLVSIMEAAENPNAASQDWDKVYAILAEAHRQKIVAARTSRLQQVREASGFDSMLRAALGERQTEAEDTEPLPRLEPFVKRDVDWTYLLSIQQRLQSRPPDPVSREEWEEVYRIVEIAQRNREDFSEPVAQELEWRNLYPTEDATSVTVTLGVEQETDSSRWKTFGQSAVVADSESPPPPVFGWAVASPLLALEQGVRTITLTLGFAAEEFIDKPITDALASGPSGPFQVQFSTEKGWVEPETVTVTAGDYRKLSGVTAQAAASLKALQVTCRFSEKANPVAVIPAEIEGAIYPHWPAMRLLLRQIWEPREPEPEKGRYITLYQPFEDLMLVRMHVQTSVQGLSGFLIENDETTLDGKRPFEPFGTSPSPGSRLLVGHSELAAKKLDSLSFRIEWMGVPQNLADHYKNYAAANRTNTSFTVKVSLMDNRVTVPLAPKAPLFEADNAAMPHTISLVNVSDAARTGRPGYVYDRAPDVVTGPELRDWSRYFQFELNEPDFQHSAYPGAAARKSIDLSAVVAKQQPVEPLQYQVNPPYTPKIKSLSIDYTSSTECVLASYPAAAQPDRIFHVQPFGHAEVQREPQASQVAFLPQYRHLGELYIGLRGLRPPQSLAVLFQMAEGSADPDLTPVPVEWTYLSNNRWTTLEDGKVLLDTTRGLTNTGIIEFSLPTALPNTLLPSTLYWIRGAIAVNGNSVCDTVSMHTQAVSATFIDQNNASDHLSAPLPAKTIKQLAEPAAEIAAIHQPYTSFGGKMAEQDSHLYTRVSERLRHKHRALTAWDYEHLILERFPQIYKVKCRPADPSAHPDNPGRIEIIVIPDVKNKLPFNPFEPKAPADMIADIGAYLLDKVPSFAEVTVKNAHYVPVKVRFAVRFRSNANEGFYKQKLNDDLIRFLSPWAYGSGADIAIGGRIYANTIIHFIEDRPYVDYVAEVRLFTAEDRSRFHLATPAADGYYVTTNRPDGVLVTARQHEIDIISEAGYESETFSGINYMKIELDFIVSAG